MAGYRLPNAHCDSVSVNSAHDNCQGNCARIEYWVVLIRYHGRVTPQSSCLSFQQISSSFRKQLIVVLTLTNYTEFVWQRNDVAVRRLEFLKFFVQCHVEIYHFVVSIIIICLGPICKIIRGCAEYICDNVATVSNCVLLTFV